MVQIGNFKEVAKLYSFPNNPAEVLQDQTLEDTIKHYLDHSLTRDGYSGTQVQVSQMGARVNVTLTGQGSQEYEKALPLYLEYGMIGLEAAKKFYETESYPDGRRKWRPNWRFFLPHGVPMVNHKTVQLLHFPPDSVLLHDRDYLAANTTKRWAQLLEASGAKRDETDQYQNIIDIAPIAAPHADGGKLEGSYSYFTKYIKKLLELWLYKQNGGKPRPLVAFGTAVKEWLKAEYDVDIKGRPPQARKIKIGPHEVPTLISYHPSYIWAAVSRKKDNVWTPDDELLGYAMKVMLPDATAAYWQVEMAKNPTLDPNAVLADAERYWLKTENVRALCKLAYQQVWRKRKETAECLSNDFVDNQLLAFAADDKTWDQFSASVLPRQPWLHISDEEMDLLSKSIGSNDSSGQPDDF